MDTRLPPPAWRLLSCCFLCGWALGVPQPLRSLSPLSSQVKPEPVPSWVPPERAEAALTFLYSGDAQWLSGANCSERYEARGAGARQGLPPILQRAAGILAQAANFLNMLLQANDIRESSVEEDVEWYQALVRSIAEGDPRAHRALLIFDPPPGASHLQLALQATRTGEETILQELSGNRMQEERLSGDLDNPALQKRVLTNDLGSLGSPKWPQGDGYVGDMQHVRLSLPFLECQEGRLRPGWLITLSATFYGLKPDLSPEVRGRVQMDVDLQNVDINQCASGPGWYSNSHLCDLNSTQCVPLESQGFVLGRYICRCRPGFYGANRSGGLEESTTQPTRQFGSLQGRLLRCQPCPKGCTSCVDATPCLVEEAPVLRAAVLTCQACCVLAVFLGMLVSYRCRQSKRIRASGLVLLEIILFGSLLLYFPVFILYLKPSVFRCIALRWVRLLGFAIVYGTIILKLYRVLQLFLSRTAQRGPHWSSSRLLQRLGLFLLLVLGFLVVWTAGVLEGGIQHTLLVARGHTPTGRHFYLCHHDRWDYIMVVAELLLLCWGSFLCYATRAVPSAFHEPRYMGIALHNELLLSAAFHAARFALVPSLHPDWTLLLFFLHTHGTVSATLALIFIPKFQKPGTPPREEMVDEVYEDELDLQHSGSYLNSSITSAWSERSLDPGDIRDELKKLYAQLEVHKTKEMAVNNPHLPKKRGSSRQGLGHSFMRCLVEFPEALAWQHSRDAGSPGHSSLPGSSRHRLLSSSLQEPEGPPALRKSRSTYDHHREQDAPLLDSLLKRKLAKKTLGAESQESVEVPPALGFRSASAHNLTVGERLPRARPISLQKSLSVAAGSQEKALLMASQAYLEETYRQAREREEQRKGEAALVCPVQKPSARRLERARGAPLSAPPSPAKSSSVDSTHASGKLHREAGQRLPHLPIRHQVSTPILALSGPCLGEPRMLSPTSTLVPALKSAPGPAPVPTLAPAPVTPQNPSLLTYICPWENAELPVRKENKAQEGPSGQERGNHSPAPARDRLWRALSVAVEKRAGGENEKDTEAGGSQGEANDVDQDRPKIFSKSHSLKAPVQQGSMYSLGLAIKALTRSRSTYREKESEEEGPEKGRVSEKGIRALPRSPRVGRSKAVNKQAALAPCDDEESLQNQQNAHTSRMFRGCHQKGSKVQEDRGRRTSQSLWEGKDEKACQTGPVTLRQVRQNRIGDNAERVKAPLGWWEMPKAGLQLLGSADCRVVEICPWEVTESETCQSDSSNMAKICPWEVSEGTPEGRALRQDLDDSQEERGKVPEKSEPKDMVAIVQKKPERLVRGQEAVCPWESPGPGSLSPQSASQGSYRTKGRSEAEGSAEAREVALYQWEVTGPAAYQSDVTKAELCPWEATEGGDSGKPPQEVVKELPQEKRKSPKKPTFWKEQKLGGDLESLCPWESTDSRNPSVVPIQASETPEYSGNLGSRVAEVCPWEVGDARAIRKAEICPWELDDEIMGEEILNQGTGRDSIQEKGKVYQKGSFGKMREQTMKAVQKLSQQQESSCTWDSTAPRLSSPCLDNSSSKADNQLLSKGDSRAIQLCPRGDFKLEVEDATLVKTEICPWEAKERTTEDWTSGQALKGGKFQKDMEKIPGKSGIRETDASVWEKLEGQIQNQGVDPGSLPPQPCPLDRDKPKASFQMTGSIRSKTAEICPWVTEETLTAEKAKICSWEVSTGAGEGRDLGVDTIREFGNSTGQASAVSGSNEIAVIAPKKPERTVREQEVACPWKNLDPRGSSQYSNILDTDRQKAGSQALDPVGSRTAEMCPWEIDEIPTSEMSKVCSWEVKEAATEKRLEQEIKNDLIRQRKNTLEKERLTSLGEDISKWEVKLSQEQEAVCAWENKDMREPTAPASEISDLFRSMSSQVAGGHFLKASDEAAEKGGLRQDPKRVSLLEHMITRENMASSKAEFTTENGKKINNELQSVCPCKSITASHPDSQCPDKPEASSLLVSVGDRVTEMCPWDAPNADAYKPDSSIKAEICPWKANEGIPKGGVLRQNGKGESQEEKGNIPEKSETKDVAAIQEKPGKADRKQEAVCPWGIQDCGGLSSQPALQASDRNTGSSEARDSTGTRVTQVCPWVVEEASYAKKAEGCLWEASKEAAEKWGLEQEVERVSQRQGEIFLQNVGFGGPEERFLKEVAECSTKQESMGSGEFFPQPDALDTDQFKVSPHRASNIGGTAELFRWEVTDPEGNERKSTVAEICPRKENGAPSEESGLLASTAIQTESFFTTATEKAPCHLIHGPLGSFLTESKSLCPKVSRPANTFILEGVTELQGSSGLGPGVSLSPELGLQNAEAQKFSFLTQDQGRDAFKAQNEELILPTVYPWDWE
ncbi:probable G-protein coupled receptor 179 [Dasypus novemcinctus]|uniref:probable G-protein coupled receptor 179 n=1 Tax=Dasypus novemcinctus TaxID=9361 RepID=UPI00265DC59C|nr:probable G-protein coupled receptor 179 [Dasypus novemcinctus]